MGEILKFIRDVNFNLLLETFFNNDYFTLIFPFLFIFAFMFSILKLVPIFINKETKRPIKPVIIITSLIVSIFSITFELSSGYTIANLMMMLFPTISIITIIILLLYIIGAIFGQDFFKGLFNRRTSAYLYFAVIAIGLGSGLYYLGIVMGLINPENIGGISYWNFVIGLILFILAIVFMFTGLILFSIIIIIILITFIINTGSTSIFEYIFDPIIFIAFLILFLISWITPNEEKKEVFKKTLNKQEKKIEEYLKKNEKPKPYEDKIFDIMEESYESNKKKWEKSYPGENYRE